MSIDCKKYIMINSGKKKFDVKIAKKIIPKKKKIKREKKMI